MQKIWLSSYEEGVQPEIDVTRYRSVVDVVNHGVQQFAWQEAFYNMGRALSYQEVGQRAWWW